MYIYICIYIYAYINTCTSNIAYIHIDIHDIDVLYYTPTIWVMGLQLEYRLVHGRSAQKSSRNTTLIQRGLVDCDQGVFSPTAECFGVFSHSKGFGADRSSSKTHSPKVPRFQVKVPK